MERDGNLAAKKTFFLQVPININIKLLIELRTVGTHHLCNLFFSTSCIGRITHYNLCFNILCSKSVFGMSVLNQVASSELINTKHHGGNSFFSRFETEISCAGNH